MAAGASSRSVGPRRRVWEIVETATPGDRTSRWFDLVMIWAIVASVGGAVVRTVRWVALDHGGWLDLVELTTVALFTVEYAARLWSCVEDRRYARPIRGRLRFARSFYALIDLMAILPFYVILLVPVPPDLAHLFPMLRLLRLLKLMRYTAAVEVLGAVLRTERRTLVAAATIMIVLLLFSSSAMYVIERSAQPEAFTSIPAAMWWGIATLTTVGYGDMTPITPLGRVFGALVTILGIGMFALPAGILANGFAQEIKEREFLVTWSLVAAVPLFKRLEALQIARIAEVLVPMRVHPGETIFERGDPGDGMYFIASGEMEVVLEPEPIRLRDTFFGEIALLREGRRTATVRAATAGRLLVLRRKHFERLLEDHPDLREEVGEVADRRLARDRARAEAD